MKYKSLILGSLLFATSLSHAALVHVCYFTMPSLHTMQQSGAYVGRGYNPIEAKTRALRECKRDLEFWAPGQCDAYYRDPSRLECTTEVVQCCAIQ